MTQEEILEYNKRCAEFLGSELKNDGQYNYWTYDHLGFNLMKISGSAWISGNFEFHSDWNWIMEIVEAICKLGFRKYSYSHEEHSRCVFTDLSIIFQNHSFGGGNIVSDSGKIVSEKEAVVQAINQFLIWYNENN